MSLFHYHSKTAGRTPYGWCLDGGKPIKYGPEQSVINQMVILHRSGLGYHLIAKALNESGIATRHNGKWTYNQVNRVLTRYYKEND
jgi:hypothetical protein